MPPARPTPRETVPQDHFCGSQRLGWYWGAGGCHAARPIQKPPRFRGKPRATNAEDGTEQTLIGRPHSRRTLFSGAAVGLAAATVGALATASPAGATADSQLGTESTPTDNNGFGASTQPVLIDAGAALAVAGSASFGAPVSFSNSGTVSIPAGQKTATYTGATLTSTSLVLANLQNSIHGVYVQAVVPNVSGNSFEVFLSKAVPRGMTAKVAWFVVN